MSRPAVWALAAGQDRDWIARLIPHQGSMCLLDEVVAAHPERLHARTRSHLRRPHPLALHGGRLGAAAGVEYASQAMALHGALGAMAAGQGLFAGGQGGGGRLVSVRDVQVAGPLLSDGNEDGLQGAAMDVVVTLEAGDARQASYGFELGRMLADGAWAETWVKGRASVLLFVG
jgi:predicted hotdog family 3-hydroxylacyl-ACP dehydratase